MLNLLSLERIITERRIEVESESRQASLLRQAAAARRAASGTVADLSGRAKAGLLLARLGLRLAGNYVPQQQTAASLCVCVPAKN